MLLQLLSLELTKEDLMEVEIYLAAWGSIMYMHSHFFQKELPPDTFCFAHWVLNSDKAFRRYCEHKHTKYASTERLHGG